jgi:CheY-like chemotaxis protein
MAQSRCVGRLYPKKDEKFKKIIILEDNKEFREQLKSELRQYVKNKIDIVEADPKKSWQNCSLCRKKGKDILDKIFKNKTIEPGEVLSCFDLDLGKENIPKTAMGDFMKDIFGGQWILYKTGCAHPKIPRLVITGYRSQDLSSHIAGGTAFLMKPYTPALLKKQIETARRSVRRRVAWICPKNVQETYSNLLKPINFTFGDIESLLKEWLDGKQVDLDIRKNTIEIVNTDLVILDILEIGPKQGDPTKIKELRDIILKIRAINPNVKFILVLPFDLERESTVSEYYTQLPLNFQDGSDNVIRKPFWFVLNGKTNPDECLGNMILEQLEHEGNFDVKYQVLVPVVPIVGRLSDRIEDILKNPERKALDELYAPLLPFLVNAFGLSGRISDIADLRNDAKKQLLEKIDEEREKDNRWKNIPPPDKKISEVLDGFLEALKSSEINRCITLESWLRHIVDMKPGAIINGEGRKDIHSLTEPLARVFGGSTRYEFSVRGSWYKEANRIDDILIVVEFCAKSSIIGRKFIRETAVKYLSKVAGEDVVLVQEIPIKGFLW